MNKYEGPSTEYPVIDVKFKGEAESKLLNYLQEEFTFASEQRASEEEKWKRWVIQANSRRKRKDAGSRDSQLDMTLTAERMSQNAARLKNPILQQDQYFVCIPRRPQAEPISRNYEKVIDYAFDRFDTRSLISDWIEQAQIFPTGIVKTPWVTEKEKVRKWEQIDIQTAADMISMGEDLKTIRHGDSLFVEREDTIEYKVGAFPEVIPIEDFFIPLTACDIRTAPWVCHRLWMTKSDIKCEIKFGRFKKTIDGTPTLEAIGESSRQQEKLMNYDPEKKGETEAPSKQYEILEFYVAYDVDGDDEDEEIMVWVDRESWKIVRCVHSFYHSYHRPFVPWCYKRVRGSFYGIPLTFILEPLHAAYSASFNQRLDGASRANELLLLCPPSSGVKELFDQNRLHGGVYELNVSPTEIKEFHISQPYSQLPELEQILELRADRISGLSDYSFGQEQISRPTATGQVQIIEESKQPLYDLLESFRYSFAEVAKHMLSRYKQFFPMGMELYVQVDPEAGQFMQEFIQWPDSAIEEDVFIETKCSSANMSKQLRKQEVVALMDKWPQLIQVEMGLAQAGADVMNPAAPVAQKLLVGFQEVIRKFTTEFDVPGAEIINPPDLIKDIEYGQMVTQFIQQLQMQIQQMGMQLQQLMGSGPGGPGGGMGGQSGPPQGVPGPGPMGQPQPQGGPR